MENGRWRLAIWTFLGMGIVVTPFMGISTYFLYLATLVLIYSIAAIGLNLLSGYAGQLSLAQAAFMAIGAYCTAIIAKLLGGFPAWTMGGMHIWLAIIAGTALAAVFGGILAYPAVRVRGPYLAMMTLAFGWIVWKVLIEWVSLTGGDLGLPGIPKVQVGGLRLDERWFFLFAFIVFLAVLALQRQIIRSPLGLQIRAVKHGDLAVASAGIDVRQVKVAAFVISSALAGLAGSLFALQQSYVNPDGFQVFDSIRLLLAVLLGGAGTLAGPVVGTAILVLLPEMLHGFERYRLIVYGGLILVNLYAMPRGLMGMALRKADTEDGEGSPGFAGTQVQPSSTIPSILADLKPCSLEIQHVSKSFGGIRAVQDASILVQRGTIHAVIGPNGAGKTTLINLITGVFRPVGGSMALDGVPTRWRPLHIMARQGIVRTLQNAKPLGDMTVLDHVLLGLAGREGLGLGSLLRGAKQSRSESSRHIALALEILGLLGIAHLASTPALELPQGHRRLLEMARALAVRPRILLLDEPAAGLVAQEIQDLAVVLGKLRDAGLTILLVEHHMDFVLSVSDRITVLDHGSVIACGLPEQILKNEQVIAAYLGPSDAPA